MDARSYHEASAASAPLTPPLVGEVRVDACVVGGGLTGLSAALALREAGASVVLLERSRIGSGASGRSGGQLIPGFRQGAIELVRRFGRERAARLFELTLDAAAQTKAIAAAEPCDLKTTGHLTAASRSRDREWMEAELRCLEDELGYNDTVLLDRAGTDRHVGGGGYYGGLLDRGGGHVNPLGLVRAMAVRAVAAGVRLHEETPVHAIDRGAPSLVTAKGGNVTADAVVLACDAAVGTIRIGKRPAPMRRRLMPVSSYTVASEPLTPTLAASILPTDLAVSDTRFALDYYRLSADRRLLFSGGERYTLAPLADIAGAVRPRLTRVFPVLATARIDHAWGGIVAITTSRYPQVGHDRGLWFAHGYSGHGMLLAQAAGRAIGEAIGGRTADFDLLAALPTRDWPGGATLRPALYAAGMLYFSLKDRL